MAESFGQTIKRLREKHIPYLSQEKLAEEIRVTQSWIFRIEHDRIGNPGSKYPEYLRKLCEYFGLDYTEVRDRGQGREAPLKVDNSRQLATTVRRLVHEQEGDIEVALETTEECGVSKGTAFVPKIEEMDDMLRNFKLKLITVKADDCLPFAPPTTQLLVASDMVPEEGDHIYYCGEDKRGHVGTYHVENGKKIIIRAWNKVPIPLESHFLGTVLWKIEPIKLRIKPLPVQ